MLLAVAHEAESRVPVDFIVTRLNARVTRSKSLHGVPFADASTQARKQFGPDCRIDEQKGKIVVTYWETQAFVEIDPTEIWRLLRTSGLSLAYNQSSSNFVLEGRTK